MFGVALPAGLDLSSSAAQLVLSLMIALVGAFLKQKFPGFPWPSAPAAPLALPTDPKHPFLDAVRKLVADQLAKRPPVAPAPAAPAVEVMADGKLVITPPSAK